MMAKQHDCRVVGWRSAEEPTERAELSDDVGERWRVGRK